MSDRFGRDDSEWDDLVDETGTFLADQARLGRLTTYTELNTVLTRRKGYRPFDFSSDRDRAAVGELLGQVTERELPRVGAMLSAIVVYLNANDAGPGFYRFAEHKGLLRHNASASERDAFWAGQVSAVHDHFKSNA